jgi:hypothetical protein
VSDFLSMREVNKKRFLSRMSRADFKERYLRNMLAADMRSRGFRYAEIAEFMGTSSNRAREWSEAGIKQIRGGLGHTTHLAKATVVDTLQ